MKQRPLTVIFLTIFLDLLGFGIIIPILPLYASEIGASPTMIGLLAAVYSLMNFLFAPFWGTLSDSVGRRPVILISIIVTALGHLLFAQASTLIILFAARILAGMGSANISAAQAYIADISPPEKRAKNLGIIGAAFGLGFIFGPPMGGAVKEHLGVEWVGYLAAALSVLNFILAWFLLPETLELKEKVARYVFKPITNVVAGLKRPLMNKLFLVALIYVTAFSLMQITVVLLWDEFYGLSEIQIGYMFGFIGICSAIVQGGLVGWLARTFGERKLLLGGVIMMAFGLLSIPFVPVAYFYPLGFLPIVFLALGNGAVSPSQMSLLSQCADKTEQGKVLGLNQSFGSLGRVIGPSIGGALYGWNHFAPYVGGFLLMFLALSVILLFLKEWQARVAEA